MQPGALKPYDLALTLGRPLTLRHRDGSLTLLDVPRWLAAADAADLTVISRCVGPILDIGCGPGRMLAALAQRHLPAVGIDIADQAVDIVRRRGLSVLQADVLCAQLGAARWRTALLLDGNIGIGGDPLRLLRRGRYLLGPSGGLLVEAHRNPSANRRGRVRFAHQGIAVGPDFPWAEVGVDALHEYARAARLRAVEQWCSDGRTFVALTPTQARHSHR